MEATTPENSSAGVAPGTEPAPVLELTERRPTLLAEPTDKKVNLRILSGKDDEEEGDGEEEEEEEMWKEEETDDQGSLRAGGGDAKSGNVSRLNVAMNIRRTIAEDLLWTLRTVPRLDELVLKHFIQTFEEKAIDFLLRLNLVKDGGARAFARALGLNSTLVELNLACNGITCAAANALGDLLENNSTLKRLDLSGNLLDQECGRRLLQSMDRNCSLTDLELRLTQCGAENLYCIGLLLAENRTRELHCQENSAETEESDAERTSRLLNDCVEERPRKSRSSLEKHVSEKTHLTNKRV